MAMQRIMKPGFNVMLIISTLLLTVGCKKHVETHNVPTPVPAGKKLVSIQEGPEDLINFTYNANGTLKKVSAVYASLGLEPFALTFTYNANNQINEMINAKGERTRYAYENGVLQKTEKKNGAGIITWIRTFQYKNNTLVKLVELLPFADNNGSRLVPVYEIHYSYYTVHAHDVREAVHFELNSTTGKMEKSLIYKFDSYDNKLNPYTLLGDFATAFFRHAGISNAENEMMYDKNYILEGTNENQYTYDADGYPVSLSQKVTRAGVTSVKTFNYSYSR
jgi:hypothetical protein